ncbi:MAG: hypothetical protein ACJ8AH_10025, partial [Stellaceae bacterium]
MVPVHYRASTAFAASFSVILAACTASPPARQPEQAQQPGQAQHAAASAPEEIDTEANILTVLGLAEKESVKQPGPETGRTVSPILWQAAHDT